MGIFPVYVSEVVVRLSEVIWAGCFEASEEERPSRLARSSSALFKLQPVAHSTATVKTALVGLYGFLSEITPKAETAKWSPL